MKCRNVNGAIRSIDSMKSFATNQSNDKTAIDNNPFVFSQLNEK